jgi:DNA modification methylase
MLIRGDARQIPLRDECVQCVVTSPPYFGLRDYGTGRWEGGDPTCGHIAKRLDMMSGWTQNSAREGRTPPPDIQFKGECGKCGAQRVDSQIGLEPSPDAYIAALVEVFREVRRVLKADGVCWLNLGDSYVGSASTGGEGKETAYTGRRVLPMKSGKPKDLLMIPCRVALALQADGWTLRSEIIWNKPNPMPESVTDRPTKSHESLFLLSKAKWIGPDRGRFAHISDVDARWLALLIDAEGCIVVKRCQHAGRGDTFAPQVAVSSTSLALMERVVAMIGHGRLMERPGKNAPMWCLQLANTIAADFLRRIYPFLIIKPRQARIGIYVDTLTYYRGGQKAERKQRTPAELSVLASLWARNKLCNQFGHPDLSDVPEPTMGRWDSQPYYYDAKAIAEPVSAAMLQEMEQGYEGLGLKDYDGAGVQNPSTVKARIIAKARYKAANLPGQSAHGYTKREDGTCCGGNGLTRNRRTVWTIPTMPYSGAHFATMPEALVEPCILAGCPLGGLVFDPFVGSGTVVAVAQRLGRKGVGLDLSYQDLARKRTAQRGLPLSVDAVREAGDLSTDCPRA